jgi:hypothetical protein
MAKATDLMTEKIFLMSSCVMKVFGFFCKMLSKGSMNLWCTTNGELR